MLDTENISEPTPESGEAKAPTRRRRAASRPAGSAAAAKVGKAQPVEETRAPEQVAEAAPAVAPEAAAAVDPEAAAAVDPEAKADVTPKRRKASTRATGTTSATRRRKVEVETTEPEVAAPEATPAVVEAAPVVEADAPAIEKPTRRRATRKTAAPAADQPTLDESADQQTPDGTPAEEKPAKAPARRRSTRAKAAPAAQEAAPAESHIAEAPVPEPVAETPSVETPAEPVATPAEEAPAPEPVKAPARRRRATRPAASPEPVEAPGAVVPEPVQAEVETPAVAEPVQAEEHVEEAEAAPAQAAPARRRRATRAAAAPTHVDAPVAVAPAVVEATEEVAAPQADVVEAEAPAAEPSEVTEAPARVEQARSRRRRATRGAAAPEPSETDDDPIGAALKAAETLAEARRSVLADPFMTRAARDAELAALAGAIAADEGSPLPAVDAEEETPSTDPDVDADEEEIDEEDAETSEDGESDDNRPARRRRRRGGRRRRRGGPRDDDSDDSDDSDESDESDDESADEQDGESSDDESDEAESGEPTDGEESGSTTRRRRRRRRRGESDREGSSDDEVTGIEGSTRMEAKRQRRKESRAAGRRRAPILSEAEFLARRESVDRKLVVRQSEDYTQLAVIEDDILVEHYVDKASATSLIGNIYVGKVQNVLPSMEAAFIDIGRGRNAVLYAGEVDWASFGVGGEHRKVENVLKSGQSVLVQVTKDPVGAKGARLTSHISLPGRYIVYSPGGHLSGISRKLPDNERHRLRNVLSGLISDNESVIVRTAAEGVAEDELVRDVNRLKAQWEVIEKKSKQGGSPQSLYSEPDLTLRIVRDLFTEDFGHLIVQGNGAQDDAFDAISAYVGHVAPHLSDRVERFEVEETGRDLFAKFRIDEQIAKALDRKVYLPSGGSLVIDRTEAMTVIDVNTGRFTGSAGNLEATVTSNNLEAAEEIVRQLRLRDLGGIIVIDFIDMVLPSNRDLLLRRLVECLGRDRTRHQVAEVTSLGLVQLTRKRIGTGLAEAFTEQCDHCHGAGYLRSDEPVEPQAPADGGERRGGNRRRRK